ncbi:hypothetical protein TVNIR_1984 [Thioalkalivibrio nitratireducens DSM 14787]|uniref:Uncharacterized protein n=1 Tax=Thioalkalivibrio nitratireducens (strain DSM 14787 / UNIQEM 213 / ALEN2) TaxID=1255043 RepID=L0DXF7_THIND|nr:hypothetical protein TVNIR_1984 [Thioalkalivibrio nitratireducens DSM 14787]
MTSGPETPGPQRVVSPFPDGGSPGGGPAAASPSGRRPIG